MVIYTTGYHKIEQKHRFLTSSFPAQPGEAESAGKEGLLEGGRLVHHLPPPSLLRGQIPDPPAHVQSPSQVGLDQDAPMLAAVLFHL